MKTPSLAKEPAATILGPADQPRIRGRIDAVDGGMVFGWAYDEAHPEDRLEVRILHAGREIGHVTADHDDASPLSLAHAG